LALVERPRSPERRGRRPRDGAPGAGPDRSIWRLDEPMQEEAAFATLRAAEATGRPLGTADFVADLEQRLGRPIARRAAGRKPTKQIEDQPRLL
jgi:hypothetical protein